MASRGFYAAIFLVQCAVSHAQIVTPRALSPGPIALPKVMRPTLLTVTQASASAVPVKAVPAADTVALQSQHLNTFPVQQPMSLCFPNQVTYATNLLPASVSGRLATPVFFWVPTAAGLNYIVERAPVGTSAFAVVASTCTNTAAVILLPSPGVVGTQNAAFIDASGNLTPGATYVYVLNAYSATGQTQWISFQWSAPSYSDMLKPPLKVALSHVGSTVSVATQFDLFWDLHVCPNGPGYGCYQQYEQPDQTLITSSFGASVAVPAAQTCGISANQYGNYKTPGYFVCQAEIGSPMGVQTFTVAAQWGWTWGRAYHVLAQSASASNQIDVEP